MSAKNKVNGFDLSEYDGSVERQNEGVVVEILHPATDEPVGLSIRVVGPDSDIARKADRAMVSRRVKARRVQQLTAEELLEEARIKLAHCTIAWEGMADKGQPLELTFENAAEVYRRAPWIMEQVAAAAGDRARFFEN